MLLRISGAPHHSGCSAAGPAAALQPGFPCPGAARCIPSREAESGEYGCDTIKCQRTATMIRRRELGGTPGRAQEAELRGLRLEGPPTSPGATSGAGLGPNCPGPGPH
ncbi:unnamed protein product [Rangifer tarandus platyrhynchus]|uniref:Uncharacterized protein n=1 Tax=Rangifer tarandus platyrhynchus TaxID=3082113 RepID=A0ABN9A8K7_RANTA|nr:unnamed protein product [Rangifer tarandus platyrhynchus]